MGLFDNKQTKEEKKIYQALLSIKNDSYALRISLPKDEKEFLASPRKEELITKYKYAIEMMGEVQLIQDLNIANLGKCYDFVDEQYNRLGVRKGISMSSDVFMGHIRVVASEKRMENKAKTALNNAKQQYNETVDRAESYVSDMEGRLRQMNNAPGITRTYDVASKMARDTLKDIGLSQEELNNMVKFNKKFPHYRKFVDYVIDGKKDSMQPQMYSTINVYSMQCKKKDPNFSLEDLLIPYILEKYYTGIKLNEEEMRVATRILQDPSLVEKMDFYIKVNTIIFANQNAPAKEYFDLFEQCNARYLVPAGLRSPVNSEVAQGYNLGRSGR